MACDHKRRFVDIHTLEMVCDDCGVVTNSPPMVSQAPQSETVPLLKPLRPHNPGTKFHPARADANGNKIGSDRRLEQERMYIQEVRSFRTRGTSIDPVEIHQRAREIGLPYIVAEEAVRVHTAWRSKVARQSGLRNEACIAGAIIVAARLHKTPVSTQAVVKITGTTERDAWRAVRRLRRQTGLDQNTTGSVGPGALVGLVSARFGIPEAVRFRAVQLVSTFPDKGYKPGCVALGAVMVSSVGVWSTANWDNPADVMGVTVSCAKGIAKLMAGQSQQPAPSTWPSTSMPRARIQATKDISPSLVSVSDTTAI
jgi:transcription initiation factor TFIIIB Brf1 subunit/transcription initiation factor TFIIB